MLFLDILKNYILPIIYDSGISLLIILLVIKIFKIKNSNTKIMFLFLPLIKPFLIIAEDIGFNINYFHNRNFIAGIRIPNPNSIAENIYAIQKTPIIFSNLNYTILFFILISIIVILLIRWINLFIFYHKLSYDEIINERDSPYIFKIIKEYSKKLGINMPRVSLTYKKSFSSPFVVGIRKSTIVLSPKLLDVLNKSETKTIIQHELSHIKRKDNLIRWAAIILRDLLFFNPFSYITYILIKNEQEKGADSLMLINSGRNPKEIAKDILNSILKIKKIEKQQLSISANPPYSSAFSPIQMLNNRLISRRINNLIEPKKNIKMRIPYKILMLMIFAILFIIQITIIISYGKSFIFLR